MGQGTVWGFAGERDLDELESSNKEVYKKIQKIKQGKDVSGLKIAIFLVAVSIPLVLLFAFFSFLFLFSLYTRLIFLSALLIQFAFYGFVTLFILIVIYFSIISSRTTYVLDNINYAVAKKFGLYYDPKQSRKQWKLFLNPAYDIFQKGNANTQVIDNQFFGSLKIGGKDHDCHFGTFIYKTGNKNASTNYRHFFSFRLNKKLKNTFGVFSEGLFFKSLGMNRKSHLELESNDFNRKFNVYYDKEEKNNIYSILTPKMQEMFLNMEETYGDLNVLFHNDFVIFDFPGRFYDLSLIDFKSFDVNPEIYSYFKNKIGHLLFSFEPIMKKIS